MKNNKRILAITLSCLLFLLINCGMVSAARAGRDAKYSVDAPEIEYDLKSGDGTTTGKTTIRYDGGTVTAEGGSTFNSKAKTGRLYGGVTADKEDSRLRSRELVMYSENFISATGDAVLVKGDKTLQAPRVDYHEDKKYAETLGGSARLSATDGSWLTAGKIVYDIKTGVANATGGVSLASTARNITGSGDRAVYDSRETGYIELIGNAKMTRDGNSITGDKLRITNAKGSAGNKTHARGNVRIVYYPEQGKAAKTGDAGKETVLAQGKAGLPADGKPESRARKGKSDTEGRTA